MKKHRRHFKVDIPLTKDHYEGGYLRAKNAGALSVSGVGYYDGSDYDYDIDEIHYILPNDHKDHNPNGKLLDLDMLETVCGWEPKEEDHIDLPVINHLIGLFAEEKDIAEHEQMDLLKTFSVFNPAA